MQIAVGIDRHRCLVAQLKSRSGCLARMEITDVAALRRFHIEPLDNTDYPIFISVTTCNFRFIVTSIAYCRLQEKAQTQKPLRAIARRGLGYAPVFLTLA